MNLYDRYNIPKATWIAMVRDGIIPASVCRHDEIVMVFQSKKDAGFSNAEALQGTAIELNISYELVRRTVNRYKK